MFYLLWSFFLLRRMTLTYSTLNNEGFLLDLTAVTTVTLSVVDHKDVIVFSIPENITDYSFDYVLICISCIFNK